MKESEFIALLNLYLDHEISAADAAKLESEVQSNLERRKLYQQYCRMQKACKLLAADFQTDVAAEGTQDKKVVAFNSGGAGTAPRRAANSWIFAAGAAGGLVAAACIALVVVNRASRTTTLPAAPQNAVAAHVTPIAEPQTMPPANQIAATPAPHALANTSQRAQQPTLVSDSLLLTGNTNALMAASAKEANEQLKWISALQIAPLEQRPEELRFDLQPATLHPDARMLNGRRNPADPNVEMNAFRFIK